MSSRWPAPVEDESFPHPRIMFLYDPAVGEQAANLSRNSDYTPIKTTFTYFRVPKMAAGRSGCTYLGTNFSVQVCVSQLCIYTTVNTTYIRHWKHEATFLLQTEPESWKNTHKYIDTK
jgi:hypothetical protein